MNGPLIPVVRPLPFRDVALLAHRFAAANPVDDWWLVDVGGWWKAAVRWPGGAVWLMTPGFDRLRGENVFCNTEVLTWGDGR